MIKPKLHHVTMKTSRLDEMIEWYGKVIGAKVQFRDQVSGVDHERPRQPSHRISCGARLIRRSGKSRPQRHASYGV